MNLHDATLCTFKSRNTINAHRWAHEIVRVVSDMYLYVFCLPNARNWNVWRKHRPVHCTRCFWWYSTEKYIRLEIGPFFWNRCLICTAEIGNRSVRCIKIVNDATFSYFIFKSTQPSAFSALHSPCKWMTYRQSPFRSFFFFFCSSRFLYFSLVDENDVAIVAFLRT